MNEIKSIATQLNDKASLLKALEVAIVEANAIHLNKEILEQTQSAVKDIQGMAN